MNSVKEGTISVLSIATVLVSSRHLLFERVYWVLELM